MWKREERKQVLEGTRGKKVQNVLRGERERDDRAHVEWMRRNERERERKERGEIPNQDGREIKWMKEI
jgi:hypothetical protein